MNVRLLEDSDRGRWDEFVSASGSSSLYHLSAWKDVVEKSFGHRTFYLLSEDAGGNILGVLPLVHMKSLLFGSFMVSLPYFNYGGICADDDRACAKLLEEAIRIAEKNGIHHIELRDSRSSIDGLKVKSSKVAMKMPLPESPEKLLKSFPSKLRSQVMKPGKSGMTARIGGEEELESFYRIFSINMRDLGTPVYPKNFFRNILSGFPGSTRICTVYMDDEPLASGFLAGFRDTLEIPWASSLRSFNRLSPNMLLYWSVLEFACGRYRVFDFGRSTPGEGTYKFKEQWGARPAPLFWHYWMKDGGEMPEINPKNPKYRMAINIWKRLPVRFATLLGPSIVRNIP